MKHAQLEVETRQKRQVLDITERVERALAKMGVRDGLVCVYTPHATAAITVNENADPNIGLDLLDALERLIKDHDGWRHDRIDDNAAAHIQASIVGPSVTIPLIDGKLALGTWQNIFLCDFDGPRSARRIIVAVV
jgi:secondary thiamine-phosphate synthase enzyme